MMLALDQNQTRKLCRTIVSLCRQRRLHNAQTIQYLPCCLPAFGHRVRQSTWGLEFKLNHLGRCGVLRARYSQLDAVPCSQCTAWKACVTIGDERMEPIAVLTRGTGLLSEKMHWNNAPCNHKVTVFKREN